ncbi:MAG: DNA adenine methylase [Akkermansia sp.]|nr:DNA adenine methylase [Akkermansia sp.]
MTTLFPMKPNHLAAPFLKWAGGKRQLVPELKKHLPGVKDIKTYIESFVGGGAMLFALQPSRAVINDSNPELINVYQTIKDSPKALMDALKQHLNTSEHYYEVRELDRSESYASMSPVERAARFIFLNKTCFNGLFRVNAQGFFNVPYGYYKNPQYQEYSKIMAVSAYLKKNDITISMGDYAHTLAYANKGAFFYLDPPYAPVSQTSNFTGYTPSGFSTEEQEHLRNFCRELDKKGALFMLSNSNSPLIRELYNEFNIRLVTAQRHIAAQAERRGLVEEVVVTNY